MEVGDPLDFWRVEDIDSQRKLVLRAEMKLPGTARLIFEIEPNGLGCKIRLIAKFWPEPFWGKLYWYAVLPVHGYVFAGLLSAIDKRARENNLKLDS